MPWIQIYKQKSTFYPYVQFLARADILVGIPGHWTYVLKLNTQMMILAKFS